MRHVTYVVVEDIKSGEWGIGGEAMTTKDVQTLRSGKP
jgi:4-oxalocrotonate tautomerase